MDKLKPCPFCGGKARIFESDVIFFGVVCKKCNAKISGRATQASAKRAWNTRTERSVEE